MPTCSLSLPREFRIGRRARLVDDGDWASPRLHLRDSERPVSRVVSAADDVQPRTDVRGAIGHRAPAAGIRPVAFRENLIGRGVKHDERVIVIHAPSMVPAPPPRLVPKVVIHHGHSAAASRDGLAPPRRSWAGHGCKDAIASLGHSGRAATQHIIDASTRGRKGSTRRTDDLGLAHHGRPEPVGTTGSINVRLLSAGFIRWTIR